MLRDKLIGGFMLLASACGFAFHSGERSARADPAVTCKKADCLEY